MHKTGPSVAWPLPTSLTFLLRYAACFSCPIRFCEPPILSIQTWASSCKPPCYCICPWAWCPSVRIAFTTQVTFHTLVIFWDSAHQFRGLFWPPFFPSSSSLDPSFHHAPTPSSASFCQSTYYIIAITSFQISILHDTSKLCGERNGALLPSACWVPSTVPVWQW